MAEFRSRRSAIGGGLAVAWLVIVGVEWFLVPPTWYRAVLWVVVFAVTAGTSAFALAEIRRVVRRVRRLRVAPERLLAHKVNEVRVYSYVRTEILRLVISLFALAAGVLALLGIGNLTVPLLFGMALGILANTLYEREDRREQRFLVEEEGA